MRETVAPRALSRPLLAVAAAIIVALAASILLWAQYGTTVFFEMIRAGLTACFG